MEDHKKLKNVLRDWQKSHRDMAENIIIDQESYVAISDLHKSYLTLIDSCKKTGAQLLDEKVFIGCLDGSLYEFSTSKNKIVYDYFPDYLFMF